MAPPNNDNYIRDIRAALEKNLGDDDIATHIEVLVTTVKRLRRALVDEGLVSERDVSNILEINE